jgi:hypothetical protein
MFDVVKLTVVEGKNHANTLFNFFSKVFLDLVFSYLQLIMKTNNDNFVMHFKISMFSVYDFQIQDFLFLSNFSSGLFCMTDIE